ncbi:MAG: hypothetical protein IPL47_14990 [Phyllobacteriaceae bacterium]|nr:hypothetical protein [Phyllobacteriaceae bacterium]
MAPRFKLDELPAASQQKIKEDIILGRRSMFEVAKQVGIADTSVARWMRKMPEEERLRILAKNRVEGSRRMQPSSMKTGWTLRTPTSPWLAGSKS